MVQSLHLKSGNTGPPAESHTGVIFVGCRHPLGRGAASMVRWAGVARAGPEVSRDRVREHVRLRVLSWALQLRRDAALLGEPEEGGQRGRGERPRRVGWRLVLALPQRGSGVPTRTPGPPGRGPRAPAGAPGR